MRVIANLDCELAWAGGGALPPRVRAKIAALGTLVRAVVADGLHAELVLPAPIDPARVPAIDGAPSWSVARPDPGDGPRVAWGATGAAHAGTFAEGGPGWRAALPSLPAPSLDVIRRVADRRFALALAGGHGVAMPGARAIDSLAGLERAIDELVADDAEAAWIAKAPITAAGRDRVRRRGRLDDATRTRVARLLARGGALVFEPWRARLVDVGQPGLVLGPDRFELLPAHALHVDATGGFAGITIPAPPGDADDEDPGAAAALGLTADEHARLRATAAAAAVALAAAGYRGPFTIDAFVWRDRDGARRLHPLCELNPRLTFGLVARAWSERTGIAPLTLRVADGASPPPGAIPLLLPSPDDPTTAWLERPPG